jgi:hypothetical protein
MGVKLCCKNKQEIEDFKGRAETEDAGVMLDNKIQKSEEQNDIVKRTKPEQFETFAPYGERPIPQLDINTTLKPIVEESDAVAIHFPNSSLPSLADQISLKSKNSKFKVYSLII